MRAGSNSEDRPWRRLRAALARLLALKQGWRLSAEGDIAARQNLAWLMRPAEGDRP